MEIFIVLLILAVVYLWWYNNRVTKVANQNTTMALAYSQLLYILMENHKYIEADYYKLVAKMWDVDSDLLDYREFNKKWEGIAIALGLTVYYEDESKTNISKKLPGHIAAKLWHNRHVFQQYNEASERSHRLSEEIMNDPKHSY
jgi:hypothetical protein